MKKLIIVGAGLVGPVLGMYLSKAGHEVDIYEKNGDPRQFCITPGRSINITLCNRAFVVLGELGMEAAVRSHCVPAYARIIHSADGQIFRQNYGNHGEAIYSIARGDLNRLLVDHAEKEFGVRFHFYCKCTDLDPAIPAVTMRHTPSARVSPLRADVIFGADGVHSVVRSHLQRHGLIDFHEQHWDQGYKEINIPAGGQGWIAEKEVLHLWPRGGYMLISFPNLGGDFTGSLHLPFQGEPSFASLTTEADVHSLFANSFADVLPYVPKLEKDFFARPVNRMTTVRCSPWGWGGKVMLVGDAAHAIYPSYGQGANAGLEDCRILASSIKESRGWDEALSGYESRRKPSTDAIADLCVEHFFELRDRVSDPLFQLRKKIERRVNDVLPDSYIPLYSMITFTLIPYDEAMEIEQGQRGMIDRLMEIEGVEEKMMTREFEDVIRQLAQQPA